MNKTPQPALDAAVVASPANIGSTPLPQPQAKAQDPATLPAELTELEAMKARIEQLERELRDRDAEDAAAAAAHALTKASEGASVTQPQATAASASEVGSQWKRSSAASGCPRSDPAQSRQRSLEAAGAEPRVTRRRPPHHLPGEDRALLRLGLDLVERQSAQQGYGV